MSSESNFWYKQPEQEKVPRLEGSYNLVAIGRSVTLRKNFSYLFFWWNSVDLHPEWQLMWQPVSCIWKHSETGSQPLAGLLWLCVPNRRNAVSC